ncbi:endonuclease domain-containing protein [Aquipuribacter nitratireducens]|uniref:Endonuclease domain-containing protein n=1 Tax=Aquipuribacter nitratireducens TaxID=650104 RepID=A0ABW0GNJ6_9MICO
MPLSDRVWTHERARHEGLSRRRLTAGREFVRVVTGHYVEACWAEHLPTRCAAAVAAVPGSVVSHWTALELAGLPVPTDRRGALHVAGPPSLGRRPGGVIVHRCTDPPVSLRTDPRRSGPGRAWCDAAALVVRSGARPPHGDLADLVAAADVLFADRPETLARVLDHLASRPGERGVAEAREALALVDTRAESPPESRLRVLMVRGGLAPVPQHEVRTPEGHFVARVDLAFPVEKVAVEYDGDHHRYDRTQWRSDLRRREALDALGWRVVVVTGADLLGRPDRVLTRVRSALRSPRR